MCNGEKRTWLREQRRLLIGKLMSRCLARNGSIVWHRCETSFFTAMTANIRGTSSASLRQVGADFAAKYVTIDIGGTFSNAVIAT